MKNTDTSAYRLIPSVQLQLVFPAAILNMTRPTVTLTNLKSMTFSMYSSTILYLSKNVSRSYIII